MPRYPKRLIEVDLPIARISAHARREKSIRHGHISTLHIWWARRPLAACRAVICAALWPDPADELCPQAFREVAIDAIIQFADRVYPKKITGESKELQKTGSPESLARWEAIAARTLTLDVNEPADLPILRLCLLDFIADFANWDNSTVSAYLDTSRTLTLSAHAALGGVSGTRPLVVDPFAGGGAIPLEAFRVGADAFASDLNPVAVLLNKVVLEYIPKYGQQLADEVRKWGSWVKEQAEEELAHWYPARPDQEIPAAYLWARTVLSESPGKGELPVEVPLLRSMWLSKRKGRHYALRWAKDAQGRIRTREATKTFANGVEKKIRQPIIEIFQPDRASDVDTGTSSGGAATCPITGYTMSVEAVRRQLSSRHGGASDARLICVVGVKRSVPGRFYGPPTDEDETAAINAAAALDCLLESQSTDVSPIPDVRINHLRGFFNIVLYGMDTWGRLFTPRQLLLLSCLARCVRELPISGKTALPKDFIVAVTTCLGLVVDRQADKSSSLGRWDTSRENPQGTFARQALPMVWDFSEVNPFSGAGGDYDTALDWVVRVIEQEARAFKGQAVSGHVECASAMEHPLPDDSAAAIVTDPPYYAAVPYADLSDFFYSWLKRTLIGVQPNLFKNDESPKEDECVSLAHRAAMYRNKTGDWFERRMKDASTEGRRIAVPYGVGVFVFASKETRAWEAMLQALVESGWTVTASWPIDTEMGSRLRAMNSATLASSIHILCRPRETPDGSLREEVGEWRDVLSQLPDRIHEWMPRLAAEGIVGADAIFACLGPALEIFSRYSRVEKASGEAVPLREYLEQVWAAVSTEALSMIFKDADAAGLEPDARLTAMWLWTLGAATGNGKPDDSAESDDKVVASTGYTLEFDAARKIAQGLGIHLEKSESIVEVRGDKARLLPVSERTRYLFGKDEADAATPRGRKKKRERQRSLFEELDAVEAEAETSGDDAVKPSPGETVLDRVHQSMILFAGGRGEALRRFLVEDGAGTDARFWKLAQSLSALYPKEMDEKRWVDGVLARKKGLGL